MIEQLEAITAEFIQRISKLEAKAQLNEIFIQVLLQDTDLAKTIPNLEIIMEGYCHLIKDMPNYENIHNEFQGRFSGLKDTLHNKQKLKNP
jgi:hypothetical protein